MVSGLAATGPTTAIDTRRLQVINILAAAAIIGAVGYRLWGAGLPAGVRQEELLLIAFGGVFAVVAVAVRPTRLASHLPVQLLLMTASAVLTVLILGVAGPWLGNDLPPLAAAAFATILLHFDLGLHARHAGYVFLVAAVALAALWVYAFTALMVTLGALIVWTLVLAGLGMLAYLTRRSVDHDLALQGSGLRERPLAGEGQALAGGRHGVQQEGRGAIAAVAGVQEHRAQLGGRTQGVRQVQAHLEQRGRAAHARAVHDELARAARNGEEDQYCNSWPWHMQVSRRGVWPSRR